MPLDTQGDDWRNATTQQKGKTDSKTGVTADSLLNALKALDNNEAYSSVELYRFIVEGNINSGYEPTDDELRAFVKAYSALTTKAGDLKARKRKQHDLSDDFELKRKRIGEPGYSNWHFALVEG